jgi:hypothetical protein
MTDLFINSSLCNFTYIMFTFTFSIAPYLLLNVSIGCPSSIGFFFYFLDNNHCKVYAQKMRSSVNLYVLTLLPLNMTLSTNHSNHMLISHTVTSFNLAISVHNTSLRSQQTRIRNFSTVSVTTMRLLCYRILHIG